MYYSSGDVHISPCKLGQIKYIKNYQLPKHDMAQTYLNKYVFFK
jgi:hypothetical protein